MLLLAVLCTSLIIGLLRGSRLESLGRHRWRFPVLPFVAFSLQVLAFLPDESASDKARLFAATLHMMSYGVAMIFVWANRRAPWLWLVGVGIAANLLVIVANGGFMPVAPAALDGLTDRAVLKVGVNNNAILLHPRARLWFLADIFRTPPWVPLQREFSPGDVLIGVGAFVLLQYLLVGRAVAAGGSQ